DGVDLDAVGLEIGIEVAPADVFRPRHDHLEWPPILEPYGRKRRAAALRPRQQHLAIADQMTHLQAGLSFECWYDREVELVGEHQFGQEAAVAFCDMEPHFGM